MADMLIPSLRHVARGCGYALLEHGSKRFDIDLVAVPWVGEAIAPVGLANIIKAEVERLNDGMALCVDEQNAANPEYFRQGCPGAKPHGRLGWTWHLGGGPYIDLSVMPPRSPIYPGDAS